MDNDKKRDLKSFAQGDLMYGRSAIRSEVAMTHTVLQSSAVDSHNSRVDERAAKIEAHQYAQQAAAPKIIPPPNVAGLPTQKRTFVATLDQYGSESMLKGMHAHQQETGMHDLAKPDSNDFMSENSHHLKYKRYTDALKQQIAIDGNLTSKTEQKWRQSATAEQDNSVFRAKSKFGLKWTLERGHHIHFAVSEQGMNMHQVATKTEPGDRKDGQDPANKIRSYTGSELRWLYRHKDDPLVKERVHFVAQDKHTDNKLETVSAPWNDEQRVSVHNDSGKATTWKAAWQDYKPTNPAPQLKLRK